MTLRMLFVAALGLATLPGAAFADERNPIGERADYDLDKSSARTSSMVEAGTMTAKVNGESAGGVAYDTSIDYRFKVKLLGWQTGTEAMGVDKPYFTPEFMAQLRVDGEYTGSQFKVRWLGFEDAHTMDGHDYPHCDRILIYDIQQKSGFAKIAEDLFIAAARGDGPIDPDATVDNMEVKADIYYGVPVLGAVKMDVTGKYQGIDMKAGADYKTP